MSRTLILSDTLHARLKTTAQKRGFNSIEQLLEIWLNDEDDTQTRSDNVQKITSLRQDLYKRYGEMPDSVDLLREDRTR